MGGLYLAPGGVPQSRVHLRPPRAPSCRGRSELDGASTGDSYTTGRVLVEVLEKGLRYYGWRGPDRAGSSDAESAIRS